MSQWFAIRTATRRERQVAAGLAERGFTFFLPMSTDWSGQPRVKHMEPLLPGYVFVLCEDKHFADLHGIEDVQGFVRYMRDDGLLWPVAFPALEIVRFQADERAGLFDKTRTVKPPKYRPKSGARVQLKAGAYLGYFAKVLHATQGERYKLMVEGFEKARHTTLDVAHLVAA